MTRIRTTVGRSVRQSIRSCTDCLSANQITEFYAYLCRYTIKLIIQYFFENTSDSRKNRDWAVISQVIGLTSLKNRCHYCNFEVMRINFTFNRAVKNITKKGTIVSFTILRNLFDIESKPLALPFFNLPKIFLTSVAWMFLNSHLALLFLALDKYSVNLKTEYCGQACYQ